MRCESKEMFETIEFSLSERWDDLKFDRFDSLRSNFYSIVSLSIVPTVLSLNTDVAVSPRLVEKITNQSIWQLVMQIPHLDLVFSFPRKNQSFVKEYFWARSPNSYYQSVILTSCVSLFVGIHWKTSASKELDDTFATFQVQQPVEVNFFRHAGLMWKLFKKSKFCWLRQMWATFPDMDSKCCWERMGHTPWFLLEVARETYHRFCRLLFQKKGWKKWDLEAMTAKGSSKNLSATGERLVQIWWIGLKITTLLPDHLESVNQNHKEKTKNLALHVFMALLAFLLHNRAFLNKSHGPGCQESPCFGGSTKKRHAQAALVAGGCLNTFRVVSWIWIHLCPPLFSPFFLPSPYSPACYCSPRNCRPNANWHLVFCSTVFDHHHPKKWFPTRILRSRCGQKFHLVIV